MRSRWKPNAAVNTRRAGTSAVEMAIVAPLLFLFIFGLFDIAHGFMVQHLIQDATRQGCRMAICPQKTNQMVLAKINRLLTTEGVKGATTTIMVNKASGDVATAKAGDNISVQIDLDASHVSLFASNGFLKGQFKAACAMRRE